MREVPFDTEALFVARFDTATRRPRELARKPGESRDGDRVIDSAVPPVDLALILARNVLGVVDQQIRAVQEGGVRAILIRQVAERTLGKWPRVRFMIA